MKLNQFKQVPPPVKALPGEEWTALDLGPELKGRYLISTMGRLFSNLRGRLLAGKITEGTQTLETLFPKGFGYQRGTKVRKPNQRGHITLTYAFLVARTFLVKPPNATVAIHLNHDKMNAALYNIRWATNSQAMRNAMRSPAYIQSQKNAHLTRHKLSPEQAMKIRRLLIEKKSGKNKLTIMDIANRFGIAEMNVLRIQNGSSWAHLGKPIRQKQKPATLTTIKVLQIKRLLDKGVTGRAIAEKFNTSTTVISRIKRGKTYKNILGKDSY